VERHQLQRLPDKHGCIERLCLVPPQLLWVPAVPSGLHRCPRLQRTSELRLGPGGGLHVHVPQRIRPPYQLQHVPRRVRCSVRLRELLGWVRRVSPLLSRLHCNRRLLWPRRVGFGQCQYDVPMPMREPMVRWQLQPVRREVRPGHLCCVCTGL
jgi:hypothetical protein